MVAVATLVLAGCATRAPHRASSQPELPAETAPAPAATSAPAHAIHCVAGNGVVVRIGADAGAAASMLQGGVLGGVLAGDDKTAVRQPTASANRGRDLYLRMDDGRKLIVHQRDVAGIAVGAQVSIDAACRVHPQR